MHYNIVPLIIIMYVIRICICTYVCVCMYVRMYVCMYVCMYIYVCMLEMQQYINISPYRDTLGSGYNISTHLCCIDISNIVIYQTIGVSTSNCILMHTTDAACSCTLWL